MRSLADRTIQTYDQIFYRFCKCYDETYLCSALSNENIYGYIEYLRSQNPNISSVTINSNIRALRTIFYFFMEKGYTQEFKIKLGKADKKIIEIYSNLELEVLTAKPNIKKCTFQELRNWAIVNFELATGARSSTTINIKVKDVDFNNGTIIFRKTKNRKQQLIPMSNALEDVLKEYLKYRQGELEDYLFPTVYNTRLTVDGLHTTISRYNQSRGVKKKAVKTFRHTFAVNYLLNGGDVFRLKELMGHSSISVTQEYVYFTQEQLKQDLETINPLDVIKQSKNLKDIKQTTAEEKEKRNIIKMHRERNR